jgi:hypothetical protein
MCDPGCPPIDPTPGPNYRASSNRCQRKLDSPSTSRLTVPQILWPLLARVSARMFNRRRRGRHDPVPLSVHRHCKSYPAPILRADRLAATAPNAKCPTATPDTLDIRPSTLDIASQRRARWVAMQLTVYPSRTLDP